LDPRSFYGDSAPGSRARGSVVAEAVSTGNVGFKPHRSSALVQRGGSFSKSTSKSGGPMMDAVQIKCRRKSVGCPVPATDIMEEYGTTQWNSRPWDQTTNELDDKYLWEEAGYYEEKKPSRRTFGLAVGLLVLNAAQITLSAVQVYDSWQQLRRFKEVCHGSMAEVCSAANSASFEAEFWADLADLAYLMITIAESTISTIRSTNVFFFANNEIYIRPSKLKAYGKSLSKGSLSSLAGSLGAVLKTVFSILGVIGLVLSVYNAITAETYNANVAELARSDLMAMTGIFDR